MSDSNGIDRQAGSLSVSEQSSGQKAWVAPKRTSLAVQLTSGTQPAAPQPEGANPTAPYAPTS